jgi:hypothetical protein
MMEFHTIWVIVAHYGYDAVVEFFVEFGDHYITHVVLIWIVKAGAVHGVCSIVNHVHTGHTLVKPVQTRRKTVKHKRHGK